MDLIPDPVAVDGERQKDDGRQGRPDHLQRVVPMAVVRLHAGTASILDEVGYVGSLNEDKDRRGEPENHAEDEINFLAADCDTGRKSVDVADALLGHGRND